MLNREDALKICEVVLANARAAGADDANVSVQSSVASHARFADNRVTTSGRSEDLGITATVWTGRRRGAATGNDASDAALKQLTDDAVSIARVSPVQREYVPTLGPLEYGEGRAFVRPVGWVDRCNLDHDRAAPSLGPTLVVGDQTVRDRTVVGGEVGDMGPEHDSVRGCAGSQRDR